MAEKFLEMKLSMIHRKDPVTKVKKRIILFFANTLEKKGQKTPHKPFVQVQDKHPLTSYIKRRRYMSKRNVLDCT